MRRGLRSMTKEELNSEGLEVTHLNTAELAASSLTLTRLRYLLQQTRESVAPQKPELEKAGVDESLRGASGMHCRKAGVSGVRHPDDVEDEQGHEGGFLGMSEVPTLQAVPTNDHGWKTDGPTFKDDGPTCREPKTGKIKIAHPLRKHQERSKLGVSTGGAEVVCVPSTLIVLRVFAKSANGLLIRR